MTFLIVWLLASFVNYGLILGFLTKKAPEFKGAVWVSMFLATSGIAGSLALVIFGRPLHWRLNPLSEKERLEAHLKTVLSSSEVQKMHIIVESELENK